MAEFIVLSSVTVVSFLGFGVLMLIALYVWERAFSLLLELLKVKKLFIEFILEKRKIAVYTPKLNRDKEGDA